MAAADARANLLPGFKGDLQWLHAQESHAGRPYWPRGASGVTLDPGLDVHHAEWSLVERVIGPHISADQLVRLESVRGLTGILAKAAVSEPSLSLAKRQRLVAGLPPAQATLVRKWWGKVSDIRVSRELAAELLPQAADPYWRTLSKRFLGLLGAPPAVHTALLSLGYNRGAGNRHLAVLRPWIAAGDWGEVGRQIKAMQQDHPQAVIRERRQLEGNLILAALGEK